MHTTKIPNRCLLNNLKFGVPWSAILRLFTELSIIFSNLVWPNYEGCRRFWSYINLRTVAAIYRSRVVCLTLHTRFDVRFYKAIFHRNFEQQIWCFKSLKLLINFLLQILLTISFYVYNVYKKLTMRNVSEKPKLNRICNCKRGEGAETLFSPKVKRIFNHSPHKHFPSWPVTKLAAWSTNARI